MNHQDKLLNEAIHEVNYKDVGALVYAIVVMFLQAEDNIEVQ